MISCAFWNSELPQQDFVGAIEVRRFLALGSACEDNYIHLAH
jgi:hypothetical protein